MDDGSNGAATTIREYYAALRNGDPLAPYFAESAATAKFGIGESRLGHGAVTAALRAQTRSTEKWRVQSHRLRVREREAFAWFSDLVSLAWTADGRRSFDTRWSGALERRGDGWEFVELHVSVAHDPDDGTLAGFGTNVDPNTVTGPDPGEDGDRSGESGDRPSERGDRPGTGGATGG